MTRRRIEQPGRDSEPLERLLDSLSASLDEIAALAAGQDAMLVADDPGTFHDALDRRQRLIVGMLGQVPALDDALRGSAGKRSPRIEARLASILAQIEQLGVIDRGTLRACEGLRDEASEELGRLARASVAGRAYAPSPEAGPRFQDRKG